MTLHVRRILLALGAAGVVITLGWAALAHIGNLNARLGGMEAQIARLEQETAALAAQRRVDQLALDAYQTAVRGLRDDLSDGQEKLAKAVLDGDARAWAGSALPDDVAGLFKPGPVRNGVDAAGQPAGSGAGAGTARPD